MSTLAKRIDALERADSAGENSGCSLFILQDGTATNHATGETYPTEEAARQSVDGDIFFIRIVTEGAGHGSNQL